MFRTRIRRGGMRVVPRRDGERVLMLMRTMLGEVGSERQRLLLDGRIHLRLKIYKRDFRCLF